MLTFYPQPGKAKSLLVLQAFAQGCGGKLAQSPYAAPEGPCAFYGAVGLEWLIKLAARDKHDYYYGDNGYFDSLRHKYFRFSRNALQRIPPSVVPDHDRLKQFGITVKPWRTGGRHVVVVEQSEQFLKLSGAPDNWLLRTLTEIQRHTDRPILVRRWTRDKAKASASLPAALEGAHCLVTHMSAAANEALLRGVPVFVGGPCSAAELASGGLHRLESPERPDGREIWAARLAASQWTLDELRQGKAWEVLRG